MLKIAAVVILYNPGELVISNILSYLDQLELLYIIDNSEPENQIVNIDFAAYPNVIQINNKHNIGLASALNKTAEQAIRDGYEFLLTMDQDGTISQDYIKNMSLILEKDKKIGILSPFVVHTENPQKPTVMGVENINVAMTSGSIIRLSAFKEAGGFLDKFFIDYVDNEYCLRIHKLGYKVLRLNSVFLYHKLGETERRKFLFTSVFPTNHSPIRWYYRTRNRMYVYKNYKTTFPDYIKFDKKVFLKDFIKILLYEPYKVEKIKMIVLGYKDYRKNKFGKYSLTH
jgi:rhamnosyltransferase